jgi:hypothetical protein
MPLGSKKTNSHWSLRVPVGESNERSFPYCPWCLAATRLSTESSILLRALGWGADADTLCCNGLVSPRIQLNVFADSPSRVIDCEEIRYVVEPTSSVDTGGVGDD